MPLFASLSKTKAFSETVGSKSKQGTSSSSPAFPPTAIQLYSTKSIDLHHQSIINHANESTSVTGVTGNGASSTEYQFAPLTYHTSTITYSSSNAASNSNNNNNNTTEAKANNRTADNPDLALWNCHIKPDSQTPSELLKACHPCTSFKHENSSSNSNSSSIPTFLLTLDLDSHNSESGLGSIQPIVRSMLQNIILYCRAIANSSNSNSSNIHMGSGTGTGTGTHLKTLESTIFGKAPLSEENDAKGLYNLAENTTAASSSEERANQNVQVNIVICGIMAAKQDEGTYREKQAVNLISYHLQKFASEINCTLCFMRDHTNNTSDCDDDDDDNGNGTNDSDEKEDGGSEKEKRGEMKVDAFRPEGLSLVEFAKALRRLCVADFEQEGGDDGDAEDGDNEDEGQGQGQNEGEGADDSLSGQQHQHQHQQPSIYAPFDYDVDLINSVLLRGAGCPGVWNANTDSLWVALPPTSASGSKSNMESNAAAASDALAGSDGDQEWLGKLADSVSAYVGNSVSVSGSGSDGKSIRSSMDQTTRTARTSANNTVATKKKVVRKKPSATGDKKEDSKDVHDFFAELLNNK